MSHLRLAAFLSAGLACGWATPALAQGVPLPVEDLVGTPTGPTRPAKGEFVLRTFDGVTTNDQESLDYHHLENTGELIQLGGWGDDEKAIGLFDEEGLAAALSALSGGSESGFSVIRTGRIARLQADYPERAAAALTELRIMLPGAVRLELELTRTPIDGEPEVLIRENRRLEGPFAAVFGDVERHSGVADFNVEIAQSAATANPVVRTYTRGATVVARARPLPFRDECVLEILARDSRPLETPPMRSHDEFGALDRMAAKFSETAFALRVKRGQTNVHEWTDETGARLRLSTTARWRARREPAEGRAIITATNLIGPPVLGFRFNNYGDPDAIEEGVFLGAMLELLEVANLAKQMTIGGDSGGGLMILPSTREATLARRAAERQIDELLQPVTLAIEFLDVARGLEIGATDELPGEGVRVLGSIAATALYDLPFATGSGTERAYLRDHDVEVAQAARIPDPKVGMFETGWFATVTAHRGPSGSTSSVDIALDIQRLLALDTRELAINAAMAAATEASPTPTPIMPQDIVRIELPRIAHSKVRASIDLDNSGSGILHRAASGLLGSGRDLLIRVRTQ